MAGRERIYGDVRLISFRASFFNNGGCECGRWPNAKKKNVMETRGRTEEQESEHTRGPCEYDGVGPCGTRKWGGRNRGGALFSFLKLGDSQRGRSGPLSRYDQNGISRPL